MQQGCIANFIVVFSKTENERVIHLLNRHIMRYKEETLVNDKMRQKHFRLMFRFLHYFNSQRLPSFENYFFDLTIKYALNYKAE